MELTNDGVFSHCLPLRRNVKATDAVMDSPACIAIDEAENRLHVQKAIMATLAGSERMSTRARQERRRPRVFRRARHELLHSVSAGARLRRAHRVRRYRRRGCRGARLHRSAREGTRRGVARHHRRRPGDLERIRQTVRVGGRGLSGPVSAARVGSLPHRRSRAEALRRTRHQADRARLHRHGQRSGALRSDHQGARRLHDHRADPRNPARAHARARLRAGISGTARLRRARQAEELHDQRKPARRDHVRRRDRSLGSAGRGRARLVRVARRMAERAAARDDRFRKRRGGFARWQEDRRREAAGVAQRDRSRNTASAAACTPATRRSA